MNRKIVFAIIIILLSGLLIGSTMGAGQFFRVRGFFIPDLEWPGGRPGKVTFDIGASNSGASTVIDTDGYLSGSFWLGMVGWARMNHEEGSVERARIVCPEEVFRDVTIVCPATGFAWSTNAGWIALSGSFIDGGS